MPEEKQTIPLFPAQPILYIPFQNAQYQNEEHKRPKVVYSGLSIVQAVPVIFAGITADNCDSLYSSRESEQLANLRPLDGEKQRKTSPRPGIHLPMRKKALLRMIGITLRGPIQSPLPLMEMDMNDWQLNPPHLQHTVFHL